MNNLKHNGYCAQCNDYVDYSISEVEKEITVKGIKIKCKVIEVTCKNCGEPVVDPKIEKENDIRIFDAYKECVGLLTSLEIKKIREKRNMTQSELAEFLSIGIKDITRYENGAIQTKNIDNMIRLVNDELGYIAMNHVFSGKTFEFRPNFKIYTDYNTIYKQTYNTEGDTTLTYEKRRKQSGIAFA